ncbi:class I SAM-dependent methyltransferase [Paenibacillus herberti]|uniref:SAM-dependent methyltransferase n=1 Tax=Paenibacillus herberti TaxID=1619309 RepID=A0A229P3M6_9BACL|nr:class I SAM-dependent methyltransferase [Paenibacillus herberti]OXM16479.1 SAM-dependent methyltransferase [Paenibacillus herberti]
MIVTTTDYPSELMLEMAARLAKELNARLTPRRRRTLGQLAEQAGDRELLVVTSTQLRYYGGPQEPPFYFHPSMAYVRVKRLRKGEADPLVSLSGCQPGDQVLDCTAGLAGDSFVFSYATGPEGGVTALESEPVLHAIVREGLQQYESELEDANAALRRITPVLADHADFLKGLPDKSYDIVYFDPMFRDPVHESSSIGPLRGLANPDPLHPGIVREAVRVARRTVIIKETNNSPEFDRLGFVRCPVKKTSAVGYGVIQVD